MHQNAVIDLIQIGSANVSSLLEMILLSQLCCHGAMGFATCSNLVLDSRYFSHHSPKSVLFWTTWNQMSGPNFSSIFPLPLHTMETSGVPDVDEELNNISFL